MIALCNDWEFVFEATEAFLRGEGPGEAVRLPHNVKELPLHYAGPEDYETVCAYRRRLKADLSWQGKRVFLQFDGAAHQATVYVNGQEAGHHACGYTGFRVEITSFLRYDADNLLAVRLDCREAPEIPPFGFAIDYLTYGGLYREVYLDVREETFLSDVFVFTPNLTEARVCLTVDGEEKCTARGRLLDGDGKEVLSSELSLSHGTTLSVPQAKPWSLDAPYRYCLEVTLTTESGKTDKKQVLFGFRTARFQEDGFYLNGKRTFLSGLNRHQSYPYLGYAAPESLQREDARILKEELGCNAVRTSHYPQSQHFLDECDRLGLAVFTELPGWQHIGDEQWKDQACENLREMILQNRNHPSVVLWGVRINESQDDQPFYTRTNAIAHELDPSRQTSGVRYMEKSQLLEDVYSFNDFSHTGENNPVRPKAAVSPDQSKGYLVSECNGHMFPTKSFDPWARRQEHALRHARVQGGARASGDTCACFGWCMFDYPTHKDFGSGDRVCYHGVLDAFRNPKLAAAVYASQQEVRPVLEIGSSMDIGDYNGGQLGRVYAFTNADEVALYKNDVFVATFRPKKWAGLAHDPILIDDTVGCLLETVEKFPKEKAQHVKRGLCAIAQYGLSNLPLKEKLHLLYVMVRFRVTVGEATDLYGKYMGNWGGQAIRWRFDGKKGGKTVISVTKAPSTKLHLEAISSRTRLREGDTYDMAAVRVRILEENGNPAPFAQLPIRASLTGQATLVGPDTVTAEGGMGGFYIKTLGKAGTAALTLSAPGLAPVTLHFSIEA